MKILIPSMDDSGMESMVSEHFGHAPFFTVVDAGTGAVTAVASPGHQGGRTPAQAIAETGAEVVLGGGMGGRAVQILDSQGIAVFLEAKGTVREALESHRQGKLPAASEAAGCAGGECPDHQ